MCKHTWYVDLLQHAMPVECCHVDGVVRCRWNAMGMLMLPWTSSVQVHAPHAVESAGSMHDSDREELQVNKRADAVQANMLAAKL